MKKMKLQNKSKMKKTVITYGMVLLFILVFSSNASAVFVKGFRVVGKTVDIDLSHIIATEKQEMSREKIKSIGKSIKKEYHKLGYKACYIKKIIIGKDGFIEIYLHESKIMGIMVSGVEESKCREIEAFLLPVSGEIFNVNTLNKRTEMAKRIFNLGRIRLSPKRIEGDHIFIAVTVKKKEGEFYGQVAWDMAYGISPLIGYYHPFEKTALDISVLAGFTNEDFRRIEGSVKFFLFSEKNQSAFYFGGRSGMIVDRWEVFQIDYETVFGTPVTGFLYRYWLFSLDFNFSERIMKIKDYPNFDDLIYDSRLSIDLLLSNNDMVIDKRRVWNVLFNMSGGWDNLNDFLYFITSIEAKKPLFPFQWLRAIPKFNLFYTTSNKRLFWSYVYDFDLIGFFDDLTATRFKIVFGLDLEFEILNDQLYIGPLINSGYFIDESDKWTFKTGTGIRGLVKISNLMLIISYSWDITGHPENGGVLFMVEGKF
ncbi:hypothetical protein ACFL20_00170 [Spirochaetota bacterium]